MLSAEVLGTALHRFRTHPFQSALTLSGLVVGTAAVIVVVTLGLSGRAWVQRQIEGVGSHLIWAVYEGTVTSGVSRVLEDRIDEEDVRAVAARTDLFRAVAPLVRLQGRVSVLSRAADLTILGTTAAYPTVWRNVRIVGGRFIDEDDVALRARVCVVNLPLYRELFGEEPVSAQTMRTLGMTFRVIGVFDEPVDTLGQGDTTPRTIIVPIPVAWFFTPTRRVDTLWAEVRSFEEIPRAMRTLQEILSERHHAGAAFTVRSMATFLKLANTISAGLILAFVLAAAVSVFVGGVGIMNILLASVEERTREVGLRLSVGARRMDIRWQFLLEAALLGVVGASLGVAVGLGIPALLRPLLAGIEVRSSGLAALLAFLFSCGVALLFGVYPAMRAAGLSPTEALRHE